MLGFFSCGKEAVVELPSSVTEGTVSNRDIDCNCTLEFMSTDGLNGSQASWDFFNANTQIAEGIGSGINSLGFTKIPINSGVFSIQHFPESNKGSLPNSFSVTVELSCVTDPGGLVNNTIHTFSLSEADCTTGQNDSGIPVITCTFPIPYFGCDEEVADSPVDIPCDENHPDWPDC